MCSLLQDTEELKCLPWVCLFLHLCVCLSACLFVCLPDSLSVFHSVCQCSSKSVVSYTQCSLLVNLSETVSAL